MKKSTLNDALRVNQKLLDLAEKASGDEKGDIEDARKTFCALIVHLSSGILQMGDAMDKQNDYIKKYQAALEIASVDIVKCMESCIEECNACPERDFCQEHIRDMTLFDCGSVFLKAWKEKAGLSQ